VAAVVVRAAGAAAAAVEAVVVTVAAAAGVVAAVAIGTTSPHNSANAVGTARPRCAWWLAGSTRATCVSHQRPSVRLRRLGVRHTEPQPAPEFAIEQKHAQRQLYEHRGDREIPDRVQLEARREQLRLELQLIEGELRCDCRRSLRNGG